MSKALPGVLADLSSRTERDLSADGGRQAHEAVWSLVQRGLVYPSPEALFVTFFAAGAPITRPMLGRIMRDLRHTIHTRFGSAHTSATLGVGFPLWRRMTAGEPAPAGMTWALPDADHPDTSTVFTRLGSPFVDSGGDLWFHIKSENADHCAGVLEWLCHRLGVEEGCIDPARTRSQTASTRSNRPDRRGGKVLGSRFSETLNNATDPLTIQQHTIVGLEDPEHVGASFVLAQRFTINWEMILAMSSHQVEDLVGRTTDDVLIPTRDDRSHIKRARAQDEHGNTTPILRLGLPFGTSSAANDPALAEKGATRRDEAGIYFAGYARSAVVLERIMDRQLGDVPGFVADRLLTCTHSDLGGLYYVPSLRDLGIAREDIGNLADWRRFPGVDWSRLERHFDQASANGYMHYNHKQYLYAMSTMGRRDRERLHAPSHRVLTLLADAFSRWQDNWYFDRAQAEMPHLRDFLAAEDGEEHAAAVMALSIPERSGWATRVMLGRLLVSEAYGFRRKRDANGKMVNGADTFRIHPAEILVGSMPNLGLGQGKYLMDFARPDEALSNFFDNLSYASGVGHIVPQLAPALQRGLGAITAELRHRRDMADSEQKRSFYAGAVLAMEGVAEHCRAFATLAGQLATTMGPGQSAERHNLVEVRDRMNRLATEAPASFVEATQLVFTLHSCLHHGGEPTAVGRLDQLLQPFYAADIAAGRLDPERAQEIIDCFWIKLGEKVQLNRLFVEDHQVFGNLAMGGSSGNYPQGSSLNQWIQQVTVGGTVADDAPGDGTPAYNDVTLLCLRAARRLPLNAPCLSLRMRPDIPSHLLHEAALAILSGGAHPILTSDAKIIPGLQRSGDDIGARDGAGSSVASRAGGRWQSRVALKDARDYAADGCYEPQLAGTSWFTLGGLTSTQPLEAALNQGKLWQSAGPVWFRGQKASFTSRPARDIESFDALVELYFQHLRWMYAKQVDGQLGGFGLMNKVCPAPLLSVFIDDCVPKGLDYYEGGPRYNVVAPCFTGLSTLVDALWAIRAMVFDPTTAVTSLPELVDALRCDWGEHMVEPFVSTLEGTARIEARAERFRRLRKVAMDFPKFGRGHSEVDTFGDALIGRVAAVAVETFTDPAPRTADKMVAVAERLGTLEQPFGGFQIQPGVGSFENYLDWGNMSGASADGRRSGDPIASDLSAAPSYGDLPIEPREAPLLAAMKGYAGRGVEAMWDGAPTDFNIREDFPVDALERALRAFAEGEGSSIMTVTCADPDTLAKATADPEKYDLLRVRMGGWSEFFVVMFPAHQAQHQRRPRSTPL